MSSKYVLREACVVGGMYDHPQNEARQEEVSAKKSTPRLSALRAFHQERCRAAAALLAEGFNEETLAANPCSFEAWAETKRQWGNMDADDRDRYQQLARAVRALFF